MLALMPMMASAQAQELTIGSKADWDAFAARVNAGETSLFSSFYEDEKRKELFSIAGRINLICHEGLLTLPLEPNDSLIRV